MIHAYACYIWHIIHKDFYQEYMYAQRSMFLGMMFALSVCGRSVEPRVYHPSRSQCFGTDMAYKMAYNIIIIKAIVIRQM